MKLQKETSSSQAEHGRWYDDACGTAFAMELIGERWSLLVVRELMLGPVRFTDLRQALPGISAKVLTERLAGLEQAGVVERTALPPPARVQLYGLTPWGYMAEPVIQELGRWAARSVRHDPTLPLSPVSLMMSFRTMLDRERAHEVEADVGFVVGSQTFRARLSGGTMPIVREGIEGAQAVFGASEAMPFAAHFYRKMPVSEVLGMEFSGDAELAARFVDLFHLPPKADG
ncbi:helix-turn-helix transcriptional regulator [Altererythrobacter sp. KTW20L]|uniref:winged helix-turn-helix transcriptional regulator n=1 Tax=Altererythrobacter sp. KTW20L TaxID=2942210 RepID=UPI0020C0BF58|nr:helix-turn-helix domain-containing protein [Altererythrobacter sp. KTW20L]MCL6249600.1 helix-turn-helix transcriptional regulator [Altererythrobacter sp. KTW20L]